MILKRDENKIKTDESFVLKKKKVIVLDLEDMRKVIVWINRRRRRKNKQ